MIRRLGLAFLKGLSLTSSFRREGDPNPPVLFLLGTVTPAWVKRVIWNFKYHKVSPYGSSPASFVMYIATHCDSSTRLLDVGCGSGTFLRELRAAGWTGQYTGLDISPRAIQDAKRLCGENAEWIAGDVETFRTDGQWDVICFIESVYYVPVGNLLTVLRRLATYLGEDGYIIMRVWNWAKHSDHIRELSQHCPGFEAERGSDSIVRITKSQLLC